MRCPEGYVKEKTRELEARSYRRLRGKAVNHWWWKGVAVFTE
jgi:hypothetical protein